MWSVVLFITNGYNNCCDFYDFLRLIMREGDVEGGAGIGADEANDEVVA